MLNKRKRFFGVKRRNSITIINEQLEQDIIGIDNNTELSEAEKEEQKKEKEKKIKGKKRRSEKRMQRMK